MAEPCGNDTCVDRDVLKKLKHDANVGNAVREFVQEWRKYWEKPHEDFMLSELEDVILRAEKKDIGYC